jgi:hypothetical protein
MNQRTRELNQDQMVMMVRDAAQQGAAPVTPQEAAQAVPPAAVNAAAKTAVGESVRTGAPVPAAAWRVTGTAVRGISHERLGMPCQDAQGFRVLPDGTLIVALADGAGSAAYSDQGAQRAVESALEWLGNYLNPGLPLDDAGWDFMLRETFRAARESVLDLAERFRPAGGAVRALPDEAAGTEFDFDVDGALAGPEIGNDESADAYDAEVSVSEASDDFLGMEDTEERIVQSQPDIARAFACTLTCVVAGPDRLAVGQIGDGAVIAAGEGSPLFTATRLQRGEYANETHFLTEAGALDQLVVEIFERRVLRLAVMSDGLIRLALKMPAQEPHAPFFQPLFAFAGGITDAVKASGQLAEFLSSERVNARTDDDKSLVLAVREA